MEQILGYVAILAVAQPLNPFIVVLCCSHFNTNFVLLVILKLKMAWHRSKVFLKQNVSQKSWRLQLKHLQIKMGITFVFEALLYFAVYL